MATDTKNQRILSEEQKAFYEENGYLVVEDVISPERCDHYIDEAENAVNGKHSVLLDLHNRSSDILNLLRDDAVLQIADELQDHRMVPIGSVFFFCKPDNPMEKGSVPHQDNYAAKAPVDSYLVIGLPFDDASPENGSLIVFPGTHKLGNLPNTPKKNIEYDEQGNVTKVYPVGNITEVPEGCEAVQLTYKRGSLIFIHGLILHYAPENPSKTLWRRKLYMHYIKDGDPFWPGWNAKRTLIDRP